MNKRKLVLQIQKMAQQAITVPQFGTPPPPPAPNKNTALEAVLNPKPFAPGSPVSVPSKEQFTPGSPVSVPSTKKYTGTGAGTGSSSTTVLPEVKEMQKAIQLFADKAVAYKTSKDKTGKIVVNKDDNRKDFNDFLAEQYSEKSKVKGKEFTTDPNATNMSDKLPTELVQMDNVIDGLRRVGSSGSEKMPDGRWEDRTNNAIYNTYAFADSLLKVVDDFGTTMPPNDPWVFAKADLAIMYKAILARSKQIKDYSVEELKTRARMLTPVIIKLGKFYDQFHKNILEHPAYKAFIKDDAELLKVTPAGIDPGKLTEEQAKLLNSNSSTLAKMVLPGKDGVVNVPPLAVGYLKDMDSFRSLMYNVLHYSAEDVNNQDLQKKVLDAMLKNVNDALSSNGSTSFTWSE